MNSLKIQHLIFFILFILPLQNTSAQDNPPVVTATGNQIYCKGTPIPIVTAFNITDVDDSETNAIYIQISSGYVSGQDMLTLNTTIPNITSSWNAASGKLTIQGVGGQNVPYTSLITAVENVFYNNTSANANGSRTFSITMGQANYLPSTQHYYQFVPLINISWTSAKTAAETSTYYGLQGYLATILSQDEAQLVGEQATGTGWIGGSDAQTEGVWKWVTGPEAGTTFWNGGVNGSTPNYAFWNNGEPNNQGEEDYAHITAPGVDIPGSWNDLPVSGSTGAYVPQGYIVEYGGMPGDPVLQISASTTITIPVISGTTPASRCGDGSVILQAVSSGMVYWYANATGGTPIVTGSSFTTPALSTTTTYYASAYDSSCASATRIAVTATINPIPTITVTQPLPVCTGNTTQLQAMPSAGIVSWYTSPTGGVAIGSGNSIMSPVINTTTTFYAEAVNDGCASPTRAAVTINALDVPTVGPDEQVVFCDGKQEVLDAGVTNVTYLWSTGATTQSIVIAQAGTYTVEVTNTAGCSVTRTFTATTLPQPDITGVIVNNTTATVVMADNDSGNYEYSLDNINYQSSNIFSNLTAGSHTAYAKSRYECGIATQEFAIIIIPKFFTPNNDAVNDVFAVDGIYLYPKATVTIFDRYGKIINQLHNNNQYWDGTLNGNNLPSNDYWYIIKLDAKTPEIKGHFSLVR